LPDVIIIIIIIIITQDPQIFIKVLLFVMLPKSTEKNRRFLSPYI